jgi:hypothetical protein
MFARIFGPHAKKLDPHLFPTDHRRGRSPVYLRLTAPGRIQGNAGFLRPIPLSNPNLSHIPPHRRFTPGISAFPSQSLIYPAGRVALLGRTVFIFPYPSFYHFNMFTQYRIILILPFTVFLVFSSQHLLDRIPRVTRFFGYLTDCLPIHPMGCPYVFVLTHLYHLLSPPVILLSQNSTLLPEISWGAGQF